MRKYRLLCWRIGEYWLIALCLLVLSACCSGTLDVAVQIEEEANQNKAIAVDVIMVYDEKTYDQVSTLSAAAWFAQRDQILRDSTAAERGFDLWTYEWIPGQRVETVTLPLKNILKQTSVGGVVFADYKTPGEHRALIDACNKVQLKLRKKDYTVIRME